MRFSDALKQCDAELSLSCSEANATKNSKMKINVSFNFEKVRHIIDLKTQLFQHHYSPQSI